MSRYCPLCHKQLPEPAGPFKPFCSWRCKLIDLGAWLDGRYRFGESEPAGSDESAPDTESKEAPEAD
ncbi:MAG: DNA gyrase inhibitor YacG [Pseudomonadota bacterium]